MSVIQFTPNPLTGRLDASRTGTATNADKASRVVLLFDCEVAAVVGDVVYQDATVDTKVIVNTDNTQVKASIGTIISKPTTTTCEVLVLGIQDGYSGLSIGGKVFLSDSGGLTSTKPGTGYVQTLGLAVAADTIFFTPNSTRVLQT